MRYFGREQWMIAEAKLAVICGAACQCQVGAAHNGIDPLIIKNSQRATRVCDQIVRIVIHIPYYEDRATSGATQNYFPSLP